MSNRFGFTFETFTYQSATPQQRTLVDAERMLAADARTGGPHSPDQVQVAQWALSGRDPLWVDWSITVALNAKHIPLYFSVIDALGSSCFVRPRGLWKSLQAPPGTHGGGMRTLREALRALPSELVDQIEYAQVKARADYVTMFRRHGVRLESVGQLSKRSPQGFAIDAQFRIEDVRELEITY